MNTYVDIRIQMCYNIGGILIDPLINWCFETHEKSLAYLVGARLFFCLYANIEYLNFMRIF